MIGQRTVGEARRILFATSNGTGLGHLTRSLAIARRLDGFDPFFITFSAGAPAVAELGFPVEYLASYDRPGAGTDIAWTLRSRDRVRAAIAEVEPELVVFDGTHPYERLLPAFRASGSPLVWCRRALWREDADTAPLHRSHLFDAILEPGEVGDGAESGPTAARREEVHGVDPIVLLGPGDMARRADAERELGLAPDRRNVLVSLGQGEGVGEAVVRCLRRLASLDDVQIVAASSALSAAGDVPEGVVHLRASYPVSRFFNAFDAAIVAGGYNAVHELAALGVPALIVPMPRDTDDQQARAREAERAGVALAATGPADPKLESLVDDLLDPETAKGLRASAASAAAWDGAEQAARWIEGLVAGGHGGESAAGEASAVGLGIRLRRGWIFAASVPRTVRRIATQRLRRSRTRVVILALGLPAERYHPEVEDAIAGAGVAPDEVLVVTDRLDFRWLLDAGVAFEHVPAADARQAQIANVGYERFRKHRVALIQARRPRPRQVIELR